MQIGRLLTLSVVIMGIVLVGSLIYVNYVTVENAYDGALKYSISKQPPGYDYSCDEPVYELYVTLSNNGTKTVSDFLVSVSNPLCKAAVPPLPTVFPPADQLKFYVFSSQENGTLTISGNNTLVQINF